MYMLGVIYVFRCFLYFCSALELNEDETVRVVLAPEKMQEFEAHNQSINGRAGKKKDKKKAKK